MSRPIFVLLTCAGVLGSLGSSSGAEPKEVRPTISVSGVGKLSAVPDVAEIQVGVGTQGSTAKVALEANNEAMNTLHQVLKERGVAAKDVRTTQIQISPRYSQPPNRPVPDQNEFVPRIVGYRVDNSVQVTARDVARLGALLDALVQAGANQVHGISFHVDQAEKLLDEVRKRAMADARRKAEILAGEAGVVLGLPRSITEEETHAIGPQFPGFSGRAAMMAAPAPMPIAAGSQELSVTVRVTYDLKPPR